MSLSVEDMQDVLQQVLLEDESNSFEEFCNSTNKFFSDYCLRDHWESHNILPSNDPRDLNWSQKRILSKEVFLSCYFFVSMLIFLETFAKN